MAVFSSRQHRWLKRADVSPSCLTPVTMAVVQGIARRGERPDGCLASEHGRAPSDSERAVRPVKVQQRSSGGCWRTLEGLAQFAVVQSYLSTARHWGITRFEALHQLFTTGPWIPPGLSPTAAAA